VDRAIKTYRKRDISGQLNGANIKEAKKAQHKASVITRLSGRQSDILNRLNKVISTAERLKRLPHSAALAMQQLELASRIMELIVEDEYEGIAELRAQTQGVNRKGSEDRLKRKLKASKNPSRSAKLKKLRKLRQMNLKISPEGSNVSNAALNGAVKTATSTKGTGNATGKIVSATSGGPSATLDIFQSKVDDEKPDQGCDIS
jgi:hypothetical protein